MTESGSDIFKEITTKDAHKNLYLSTIMKDFFLLKII
jgi:hypothetical protein